MDRVLTYRCFKNEFRLTGRNFLAGNHGITDLSYWIRSSCYQIGVNQYDLIKLKENHRLVILTVEASNNILTLRTTVTMSSTFEAFQPCTLALNVVMTYTITCKTYQRSMSASPTCFLLTRTFLLELLLPFISWNPIRLNTILILTLLLTSNLVVSRPCSTILLINSAFVNLLSCTLQASYVKIVKIF